MKFYIQKLTQTPDIKKTIAEGENMLFFMGESFCFSMLYDQEIKSGKNKGKTTQMVDSIYFSYFVDFDFYEKSLKLNFNITSPDDETKSFCFFKKINQSLKSFDKKTVKLKYRTDMLSFKESYRREISSEKEDIHIEIYDFLKKEIIESINIFEKRINSIKELDTHKDSSADLLQSINVFKKYTDIFIEEKIEQNFSNYIEIAHIDYRKSLLDKTVTNDNKVQKFKI